MQITGVMSTNDTQERKRQSRHNAIADICKMLHNNGSTLGDIDINNAKEQIERYKSEYFRWSYSEISNFIFALEDPGNILTNVEKLQEHLEIADADCELIAFIDKLWDHFSLAQQQKTAFRVNEKELDEAVVKRVKPEVAKMENEVRKELVSLIAIFTALSFVIFGGISSLDNIFDGARSFPILQVLIIGCVWGVCIFNIIFVFVYFVSKLTKLELSSTDDRTARLSRKYPAWVWGNYALLFILAVTSLMYFVDYSNSGGWLINLFRNYSVWAFVAGMVLIILLFGLWAMNILGLGIFKDKKSKIKKL